jgi:hypothetical protein
MVSKGPMCESPQVTPEEKKQKFSKNKRENTRVTLILSYLNTTL